MTDLRRFVRCPETITSPAPEPAFMAVTGLGPNEPCGAKCRIVTLAPVMLFLCPRGHGFLAGLEDVEVERD